jgi:hypothetical protein
VEQQRFADTRREIEHVAQDAATEPAGDQKPIARPAAGAGQRPTIGRLAQGGDVDHQRPIVRIGVAAGDGHVELGGQRQ